jgi:RNA recognition motif-containing protein
MLPPPPSSLPLTSHNKFQTTKRTKLFVGNLSSDTTLKELIALFSQYGLVNEKLCVVKDDNYAFIHFFNEKEADLACKALNDSFFKNRYIRVQYSTSQGHIKKTPAPASLGVTRSSSAFCFNTSVSQMTDSLLLGLNDQQCKSNLLIPASLLKSIESLNEQQNLNQQHVFKQRNTLATSQSMQSFTISGKKSRPRMHWLRATHFKS